MNDSLDLRNRIMKMRETNNVVLDQVKSVKDKIELNNQHVSVKFDTNINTKKENQIETKDSVDSKNILENNSLPFENKKILNSNLLKKDLLSSNVNNEKITYKQNSNSLVNENEAQFRLIAVKFNEAVEVILELSNKVKNLEETVNDLTSMSSKNVKKYSFINLKSYVLIILTTLITLSLFIFPVDLSLIKLIITDIIASI